MARNILKLKKRRVIIDVDTEKDFFLATGKRCIRNHRRVLANIRRVAAWARRSKIKWISTIQAYSPEAFSNTHDFCLEGTDGIEKISYTLRSKRKTFVPDGRNEFPKDLLKQFDQAILYKRTMNPFEEPRAERMLTEMRVDEFIVIGANAEGAVAATVLGLLQRGKRVTVITDAVGYANKDAANIAMRKMRAKGANVIETKAIAGHTSLKNVQACDCDRCRGKLRKANVKTGAA